MPEIADKLRRLDSDYSPPTYWRPSPYDRRTMVDVALPWDALCDFLELAESIDHPAGVSGHEWGVRRAALQEAVRRL